MTLPAIVLVDTLYGGNLGSVVRAMANFGLSELRLVRPAKGIMEDPQLVPMARSPALPILKNALIFEELSEAIADFELALGFTARLGKKRAEHATLRQTVGELSGNFPERMAAVFGSEDKGLSNSDLELCHRLVRIPTSTAIESLNLSQAVCLFAYEAHEARLASLGRKRERKAATVAELEGLYGQLQAVLMRIGFIEEASPARMMNNMRRIISRRSPDPRDVRIIRGVLSKVELAIERAKAGKDI